MNSIQNRRIAIIAVTVLALDQLTKYLVHKYLPVPFEEERIIIPGFFKFVHWNNTGAAWSMFNDSNTILAVVALVALFVLYRSRHHFEVHTLIGQVALGLVFGGIVGNLADRMFRKHVTDFLRFYLQRRGAEDIGFPAFNVADSAICIGVCLIFLVSLKIENQPAKPVQPPA